MILCLKNIRPNGLLYHMTWPSLIHSKFPRLVTCEDSPADFYIFCDASKRAYDFAAYSVQDGESYLAFAKAKVAPMKPKRLSALELLAVFLAIQCLLLLLKAYSLIRIGDIVISVDTQVVLSFV